MTFVSMTECHCAVQTAAAVLANEYEAWKLWWNRQCHHISCGPVHSMRKEFVLIQNFGDSFRARYFTVKLTSRMRNQKLVTRLARQPDNLSRFSTV